MTGKVFGLAQSHAMTGKVFGLAQSYMTCQVEKAREIKPKSRLSTESSAIFFGALIY